MPPEGTHSSTIKDILLAGLLVLILFILGYFRGDAIKNLSSENLGEPVVIFETVNEPIANKIGLPFAKQKDLLGRAELSFLGSTAGRAKNIELGIARINGSVIGPGEEFSFTKAMGSVTPEDGFSEERVFLNGEVIKGLGGGLCQVSSTLFQSVINSGLPVTERTNHSFSVVLYDVGLDATYADPGPDLKFVNDTGNPITIEGRTEGEKAIFEIYGVYDGRIASTTEAEISNIVDFPPTKYVATTTRDINLPECINIPQIGYTAKIIYNILYANGEKKEQIFTSKYNPLHRVCYITTNK